MPFLLSPFWATDTGLADYAAAIAADGAFFYMPLQEATVAPDDVVGSYSPVASGSTVTANQPGPNGGTSYRLTGSGIITVPSFPNQAGNNDTYLTWECWYKPVSLGGSLMNKRDPNSWGPVWDLTGSGQMRFGMPTLVGLLNSGAALVNDTNHWYHLVATYDGNGGWNPGDNLFIDGATVKVQTDGYALQGFGPDLKIGSFDGYIAHVAVYNTVLSDATIAAHYAAGS